MGMLIGLGKMIKKVSSQISLLANKILGYTSVTSVPVLKRSLILHKGYALTQVSKKESPTSWEQKSKNAGVIDTNGTSYLITNYDGSMDFTLDMETYTPVSFPKYNPYTQENDILGAWGSANSLYTIAGLPTGIYLSYAQIGSTKYYFKSNENLDNLEPLILPTGFTFDYVRHLGTVGDNSYLALVKSGYNETKVYRTSKIEANGTTGGVYSQPTYTEVTSLSQKVGNYGQGFYYFGSYEQMQYANGIYAITMESSGREIIMTSSDGINFTESHVSTSGEIALTSHNNTFIYVDSIDVANTTGFFLYTTSDFISTNTKVISTPESFPGGINNHKRIDLMRSAVVNNKLYIPVFNTRSFIVSEDADTFYAEDAGTNIEYDMELLAGTATVNIPLAGGSSYYTTTTGSVSPLYMALGNTTGPIAASTDGINWTQTIDLGDWENGSPVYGNGIWAASNPNGKVYTTTDGYNWSMNRPLDEGYLPAGLTNIKFLNNKFIMFKSDSYGGENYKSYVSTNAKDWTITSFTGPNRSKLWAGAATVIYGNGLYVTRFSNQYVTDTYVEHFAYSTDAINWNFSSLTLDTTSSTASGNANNFVYFDGKFILISSKDGKVYHSTDLQNWTTVAGVGSEFYWFNNNDQKMLVVTADGNVKYSSNGVSWTTGIDVSNILGFEAQKIISVNNQFVITPNDYNSTSAIVSSDAINWNLVENLPVSSINYIDYANNYYLIGGGSVPFAFNYSTSLTSSSTWTESSVQGVYGNHGPQFNFGSYGVVAGSSNTLVEVQVSIGDQGSGTAEVLTPVTVYRPNTSAQITSVTLKNTSPYPVSFDLGILVGVEGYQSFGSQGSIYVNDKVIQPGQTVTELQDWGLMYSSQRIVVLPSSVDALEVKVYGTEL